jgi:hypothetical protein
MKPPSPGERSHPTLKRIDRVFISNEWEALYPCNDLHPLSSLYSDHAPLLLRLDNSFVARRRFHFRAFWPRCVEFLEAVQHVWHCLMMAANPFQCLDWLLRSTARVLRSWSDRFIRNVRLQLAIAQEVVLRLEQARDNRPLTSHDEILLCRMKLKLLGASLATENDRSTRIKASLA